MRKTISLAAIAAAAVMFAVPQSASAAPPVSAVKEINQSNVEKTHYRGNRYRGYRRGYHRRGYGYGHRHYRRKPGFGIYLGF